MAQASQDTDLAAFGKLRRQLDVLADRMLERARAAGAKDAEAGARILRETEQLARVEQACRGRVLLMLAQAQRVGAAPGGLDVWVGRHLDVTRGSAIGVARQAKALGALPQLAAPLTSGNLGPGTISALARTARAVRHKDEKTRTEALAETLSIASAGGADQAKRHVRVLEETLVPGRAGQRLAKARERSFLRISPTESEMCRIEGLLDAPRATVFRAVLDQTVAAFLRARQHDGKDHVPEDVATTEQLQAEALVRMAQNFAARDAGARGASFTLPTLYTVPLDPGQDAGLAETAYGDLVPREFLPPLGGPGVHLLEHDAHRRPIRLDHAPVDQDPSARLASRAQRIALAFRDRGCTFPGCSRTPLYAQHAHHKIPFRDNGPTALENLTLLCAEHHNLIHCERR